MKQDIIQFFQIAILAFILFFNIAGMRSIIYNELSIRDFLDEYKRSSIGEMLLIFIFPLAILFLLFYNLIRWEPFGDKNE